MHFKYFLSSYAGEAATIVTSVKIVLIENTFILVVMVNCRAEGNLRLVKDAVLQSQKGKVVQPKIQLWSSPRASANGFQISQLEFCDIFSSLHFLLGYLAGPAVLNGILPFLATWMDGITNNNCMGRLLLIALLRTGVKCLLGYDKVGMFGALGQVYWTPDSGWKEAAGPEWLWVW